MKRALVLLLYNLLLPVALLAALPGHLLKMRRRGGYRKGFGERLGVYSRDKRCALAGLDRPLWIHAVSVGEVNIAAKLIVALREADPGVPIVLSTTTPTGQAIARRGGADVVIYHPLDLPPCARSALRKVKPRGLVLVEAEVWPNLVSMARRRGIPISLVNARLSPRSERRYRKFRAFAAPVFGLLDNVCVQELEDVARWEALGVPPERITHAGSIKFDAAGGGSPRPRAEFRALLDKHLGGRRATILLAGSTHAGEEALIGGMYLRLRERFPDLHYLVAPRHAERRGEILEELRAAGLNPALRSEGGGAGEADCLVIDSTGELGAWYCEADLVVIGKSFLAEGGQNPVEPLFAGKPVFYGPHMENFAALVAMLDREGGAEGVEDIEGLEAKLSESLERPAQAEAMVGRAIGVLAAHDGAAARTAAVVLGAPVVPVGCGGD